MTGPRTGAAAPGSPTVRTPVAASRLPRHWLRRWIVVVAIGEAAGFAVPAVVGVLTAGADAAVLPLLAAGAVEGAVLGLAQASVLRRIGVTISRRNWILLTAGGAVVAYALGLMPSTLAGAWTGWPWPLQALADAVLAGLLLASIGTAQWIELRRHLRAAGWWIAGTAAAWLAGLAAFLGIAMPLWQEGQSPALAIGIGVVAGAVMAVAMSTITGLTLARLLAHPGNR